MADPTSPPLDRRPSRRKTRTLSLGRWTVGRDGGDDTDDRAGGERERGAPSLNAYAAARVGGVGGVTSEVSGIVWDGGGVGGGWMRECAWMVFLMTPHHPSLLIS